MIKRKIIVLFAMIFGTIIVLVGCGPELIDCPDNPDEATAKIGRTESGTLYEFGAVLVYYDQATKQQMDMTDKIPFSLVNDFLVKEGYTPKVKGFIFDGEVISLGSDVDTYPMLKDLKNIPGVEGAYLHGLYKTSLLLYISALETMPLPSDGDEDLPSVSRAIIEVGRLEDGSLYELGIVLVKYDEMHTANTNPAEAVDTFFHKKGYTPKTMDSISGYGYKVMHVGDCVDTAPMLVELKTIPGVADARLNQLHTVLDIALDKSDVPGVSQKFFN